MDCIHKSDCCLAVAISAIFGVPANLHESRAFGMPKICKIFVQIDNDFIPY